MVSIHYIQNGMVTRAHATKPKPKKEIHEHSMVSQGTKVLFRVDSFESGKTTLLLLIPKTCSIL